MGILIRLSIEHFKLFIKEKKIYLKPKILNIMKIINEDDTFTNSAKENNSKYILKNNRQNNKILQCNSELKKDLRVNNSKSLVKE